MTRLRTTWRDRRHRPGPRPAPGGGRFWTAGLIAVSLQVPAPVAAQFLPTEPIRLGNGRLVVGGEASVSVAAEDDGWFNYTGYEQSTLRQVLVTASTSLSLGRRVELLGEIRTQTGRPFDVYALFVRLRPWRDRPIDVQVGRIPPTFGTFARQSYGTANWLIGSSLPYQYLTSLRPDALPATADDLLRMRARGWRPSYPVGAQSVRPGVPLVSGLAWDTGIQTRVGDGPIQVVAAVTTGSPSNPLVRDDNGGKQLATRAIWRPRAGVALGLSAARADFVSGDVRRALGAAGEGSFRQSAVGVDVELSRGHWVVRGEALSSAWSRSRQRSRPAIIR